ncbi:hypothetical protein RHGRI_026489 [Rhododendron griersonianum]|uniref:Uncharacterized protein n=1 Tax=Rhododendron griersonianum TaxID=479676 RepID=A0AAV6IXG9_9ERIC|nr:hypothetical protein RHGRI_026489 [Rhododendron griersonianum]
MTPDPPFKLSTIETPRPSLAFAHGSNIAEMSKLRMLMYCRCTVSKLLSRFAILFCYKLLSWWFSSKEFAAIAATAVVCLWQLMVGSVWQLVMQGRLEHMVSDIKTFFPLFTLNPSSNELQCPFALKAKLISSVLDFGELILKIHF